MAFRVKEKKATSRTSIKDQDRTSADHLREKRHDDLKSLRKDFNEERLQKRRECVNESYSFTPEQLNKAIQDLTKVELPIDEKKIHAACQTLRRDMSEGSPESFARIKPHIARLCELMAMQLNPEVHFEVAWAMINAASGPTELCALLINHKAPQALMKVALATKDANLQEQCLWGVANIAGDNDYRIRHQMIRDGVVRALVQCCLPDRKPPNKTLRQVAWTLSNLFRGTNPPVDLKDAEPAFKCLMWMLKGSDSEMVCDACWTFAHLLDDKTHENSRIEILMKIGVFPLIAKLLKSDDSIVAYPALHAVGNIVSGTDGQTIAILKENVAPTLVKFLDHKEKKFRKHSCWALSNIAGGLPEHVVGLISAGVIPPLLRIIKTDTNFNQKEAQWVIYNASETRDVKVLQELVRQGTVPVVSTLLKDRDAKVVGQSLEILQNLLEPKTLTEEVATSRTILTVKTKVNPSKMNPVLWT
jgi:hypothetical protein